MVNSIVVFTFACWSVSFTWEGTNQIGMIQSMISTRSITVQEALELIETTDEEPTKVEFINII